MTLDQLNSLSTDEAMKDFLRCCGARRWAEQMAGRRPFAAREEVMRLADEVWAGMERADMLEAFSHHPKIGDVSSLREKFAATRDWAKGEQAGVAEADDAVLRRLADGNRLYEQKFGYIFIVCATGKTAGEMLRMLEERLQNDPETELRIAAGEQQKITRIRLEKLLS